MLTRLEVRELPLVCEWDTDDGKVAVAFGGEREVAWDRMIALHHALKGASWVDDEMREKIKSVCGLDGVALVWRAQFSPAETSELVPRAISAALGVPFERNTIGGQ